MKITPVEQTSEEFQRLQIKHQITIVQLRIYQETGKTVKIETPTTEEDKFKLKEMYDKALEKYS